MPRRVLRHCSHTHELGEGSWGRRGSDTGAHATLRRELIRSMPGAIMEVIRRLAHWFTVEFVRPVVLAVPVGADAHFGLGQFGPIEEE